MTSVVKDRDRDRHTHITENAQLFGGPIRPIAANRALGEDLGRLCIEKRLQEPPAIGRRHREIGKSTLETTTGCHPVIREIIEAEHEPHDRTFDELAPAS